MPKGSFRTLTRDRKGDVSWEAAKGFAHALCAQLAADQPERYVVNMAKKARTGRIYLDYLRNDRLATAVAPLSTRARPGATVSMPIDWPHATRRLDPARFDIRSAAADLAKSKPWSDYAAAARPLQPAIRKLVRS